MVAVKTIPRRRLRSNLQPEVVFGLVCDLSVVIADVALPDQAVDGPLVRVGAVPQHAAVVKTEFVFGIR